MNGLLRVLQIEDSESDAALIVRTLEKARYDVEWERVEDAAGMRAALAERAWDAIIADYHLPQFDAPAALRILYDSGRDIPFIVVSGRMGEDTAVEMMKSGAHDYVLKSNLARLVPAVEREIREARTRLERRQAEQVLERQNQLLNLSHDAIITADSNRVITAWNAGAEELYGWTEAEAVGDLMHRLFHTGSTAEIDETLRLDGHWDGELVHTRHDGRPVWVESRQVLLRDAAGAAVGLLEINRDITDRKRAEESLRESERRERNRAAELGAIMDAVPVALFISRDPECRKMIGNRRTYELLGLSRGANLSKSADPSERPETYKVFSQGVEIPPEELPVQTAARTGRPVEDYEFDLVLEDGTRRNLFGNAVPQVDDQGRPCGAVAGFLDITERKRMEERLRDAQRAESIGLLAAGIAHDFNNILTAVSGNISLAMEDLCPDCQLAKSLLGIAVESVQRAASLTRQLLAYAGKGAFLREPVSVSDAAEQAARLLRTSVPKDVELRLELAAQLPPIHMDPSQMQLVLANLVLNGAEAIGEDQPGTVTVRTSCEDGYVRIEVTDTGCGMDAETQKRIFEPFFTTKFLGRGLGLAAVHGIVGSLNGRIAVSSAPGRGTRVQVLLPETKAPSALPARDLAAERVAASGAVLIVDDEAEVRKLAAALLGRRRIPVFEASTGQQAIDCLAAHAGEIRAVLLDMTLPELHGHEALPIIRRMQPGIHVIVSSGYSEAEVKRQFSAMDVQGFLPKPYTGEQLLAHILPALEAGPAGKD